MVQNVENVTPYLWVVEIGVYIRERRDALGMSAAELAKLVNLSTGAITSRERGHTRVRLAELPRLAKALKVKTTDLESALASGPKPRIPIINRTAAGQQVDNAEWGVDSRFGFAYTDADVQTDLENVFALVVDGQSMAPTLNQNDLVIIRAVPPDADNMPAPGSVVYIRMGPDHPRPGGMLCRWYPQDGGTYLLRKDNAAFPPQVVPREHVEQFGIVIQHRRPLPPM
jgi:transcriptional regulator with XRE-family HTH domain